MVFLIAVPVLTMRSFAEEKKSKTDQLLLTAPVSPGKLVLGKYLAMVAVLTVDIAVFCVAPLILRVFGTVPMGESYIAILAFWLYGSACIAVGMFISSLKREPGDRSSAHLWRAVCKLHDADDHRCDRVKSSLFNFF